MEEEGGEWEGHGISEYNRLDRYNTIDMSKWWVVLPVCVCVCVCECMYVCMYGWMDGCMDGCICVYICTYVCMCVYMLQAVYDLI